MRWVKGGSILGRSDREHLSCSGAHLSDSLSNLPSALKRLVVALEGLGGLEKLQVSGDVQSGVAHQSGGVDVGTVRLQIKENRRLSPAEVGELVMVYEAGASQVELAQRFGLHLQTVRAHLRRQGVRIRPQWKLTAAQEDEVVRLYVEKRWTLAELATQFKLGRTTMRRVLMRRGVERRGRRRRKRECS